MAAFLLAMLSASLSVTLLLGIMLTFRRPLLSRYRARTLYGIGLLLIALLLVPWRPSLLPDVRVNTRAIEAELPRPRVAEPAALPVIEEEQLSSEPVLSDAPAKSSQSNDTPARFSFRPIRWEEALLGLWLLGALAALAVRIWQHARFLRVIRRWRTPPPEPLQAALESACAELSMQPIPVWCTPLLASPTAVGLARPMLLLPDAEMPPHQLSLVLRHELCHVRRGDLWGKALIEFALIVHWFNPMLMMARRGLSALCEMACDEAVLGGRDDESRAAYLQAMLNTLSAGLCPPVSTRFDGGVKNMKLRIERLLDVRPRKLGVGIVALALILALCTGNVLASKADTTLLDGRAPLSEYDNPEERMSDEDYLFVMGLRRPDMERLSLAEWHEILRPDLVRLSNILNEYPTENRFMELLRFDIEEMTHFKGATPSTWDAVNHWRRVLDGPAEFLLMDYSIYSIIPDLSAVTVGRRDAIMDEIHERISDEFVSRSIANEDNTQLRQAMRALLSELSEEYSDDDIRILLLMHSLSVDALEPMGDYPEDDFNYLMSFAQPGYLQMSVEEFNQSLSADQEQIVAHFDHYSTHGFLRTLENSIFELRQTPHAGWVFSRSDRELYCALTLSWDIPDPGAITVAERDALLNQAMQRAQLAYTKYLDQDMALAEMTARIEEACLRIAEELSGEKMTLAIGDVQLTTER